MAKLSEIITKTKRKHMIYGGEFRIQLYYFYDNIDDAPRFKADIREGVTGPNINLVHSNYRQNKRNDFFFLEQYRKIDGTGGYGGYSLSYTNVPRKDIDYAIKIISPESWKKLNPGEEIEVVKKAIVVASGPIEAPNDPCCKCGSYDPYNMKYGANVLCYKHMP